MSFLMRVAGMVIAKAWIFAPRYYGTHAWRWDWEFGYEMGRVARSIAQGHGFGSPFHGLTGPTAWQPPLYPYFLAGIFRLFGVYSVTSAVIVLTLNCIAAAATCFLIYRIANRIAGTKVALWSAWLWAVLPNLMEYDSMWAWETSFSTFFLLLSVWWVMKLPEQEGFRPWLRLGLLWGVIALTNTSLLSMMPFLLAWGVLFGTQKRRFFYYTAAFAIMFAMTIPWNIRDRFVMGKWMFIRDNFWAEMSYGNGETARGAWMSWRHPGSQITEMDKYVAMGELNYIADRKREMMLFLRNNKHHFAKLTLIHAILFWSDPFKDINEDLHPDVVLYTHSHTICFSALAWIGLVILLRHRSRWGWLLAPAMMVYPCLYYITSSDTRYRHPIEPIMLILTVYAVVYASNPEALRAPERSATIAESEAVLV